MRELLSLRRNEEPIVGEIYRYKDEYLKCVADNASPAAGCEKCYFDAEGCGGLCDGGFGATPRHHFEQVPENEAEIAADVKFRHVEETGIDTPVIGERLIAAVGLVEYVETSNRCLNDCIQCDLTQRECDESSCDCGCFYRKVKQ
jgi:hypothetical protein